MRALYQFLCKKCGLEFEEFADSNTSDENYPGIKCEHCGSEDKERSYYFPAYNFTNPVGTDRWNSDEKGHDYRFNYNLPNVINQRAAAEQRSHMGQTGEIYREIDDFKDDKNFGPVR